MYTTYCPYCRIVTNLNESITLRTVPVLDGKTETIVSRTYHCESCCSFVRSEDERVTTGSYGVDLFKPDATSLTLFKML